MDFAGSGVTEVVVVAVKGLVIFEDTELTIMEKILVRSDAENVFIRQRIEGFDDELLAREKIGAGDASRDRLMVNDMAGEEIGDVHARFGNGIDEHNAFVGREELSHGRTDLLRIVGVQRGAAFKNVAVEGGEVAWPELVFTTIVNAPARMEDDGFELRVIFEQGEGFGAVSAASFGTALAAGHNSLDGRLAADGEKTKSETIFAR